jgi:hypothetical protein
MVAAPVQVDLQEREAALAWVEAQAQAAAQARAATQAQAVA